MPNIGKLLSGWMKILDNSPYNSNYGVWQMQLTLAKRVISCGLHRLVQLMHMHGKPTLPRLSHGQTVAEATDRRHIDPMRRQQTVYPNDHRLFHRRGPRPMHGREYAG